MLSKRDTFNEYLPPIIPNSKKILQFSVKKPLIKSSIYYNINPLKYFPRVNMPGYQLSVS